MLAVCLELCSTHEREKIDVIFETRKFCEASRGTLIAGTRLARRKPFLGCYIAGSCGLCPARLRVGRTWTIACRLGKEAGPARRRHFKGFNDKTPASSPELRHLDSQDYQDPRPPSLTTIINTEAALSPAADLFVQVQQRRSILLGSTKNECNEKVRRDGADASGCGLCWYFMG